MTVARVQGADPTREVDQAVAIGVGDDGVLGLDEASAVGAVTARGVAAARRAVRARLAGPGTSVRRRMTLMVGADLQKPARRSSGAPVDNLAPGSRLGRPQAALGAAKWRPEGCPPP